MQEERDESIDGLILHAKDHVAEIDLKFTSH
jgi:hypothetical protein